MTSVMKSAARLARLGGFLVVLALSCTPDRPEPGSDLPVPPQPDAASDVTDELPPMQPGSQLNGTFVAVTLAKDTNNVVKVTLALVFTLQQTGKIEDGTATLSGTVHIDQYEALTKKDFSGVAISKDGAFEIQVQNMLIPQALSPLLAADVTDTTVTFGSAQVINSCEFKGHMVGVLRNITSKAGPVAEVTVSGDFDALGTDASCASLLDGGLPEAGGDAAPPDAPEPTEAAAESGAEDASDSGSDGADDVSDAQEGS